MISIAVGSDDARAALRLAESDARVFCSAGVHPLHSDEAVDWALLRERAAALKGLAPESNESRK